MRSNPATCAKDLCRATSGLIYQPSNCTAYLLPINLTPMMPLISLPQYESSFALTIPNDPTIVGFQFLAQWLTLHSQCGIAGCGLSALITSDAAAITIGP